MAFAFLTGGLLPVAEGILPRLVATAPNDEENPRMGEVVMEWRSRYLMGDGGSFTSNLDLEAQPFSALLVSVPQGGYGDIVFLRRFAAALKAWYPRCTINVMSQDERCRDDERWGFYRLAVPVHENVEEGSGPLDVVQWADARRESPRVEAHDMVFVLPHISMQYFENWAYPLDMVLSRIVQGVTPLNAVSVGEYNESGVDLPTGIPDRANARAGLLISEPPAPVPLPEALVGRPFVLAYVTPTPGYGDGDDLLLSAFAVFCEAATEGAGASESLTVLVPPGVPGRLGDLGGSIGREVYFHREGSGPPPPGGICIRGLDTLGLPLPLEHSTMFQLMRSSAGFVMVTGDQSLTDAISVARSCCPALRIFYQRTIWKEEFFAAVVAEDGAEAPDDGVGAAEIRDDLRDSPPDFRELGKPLIDRALRLALDPTEGVVEELRSLYDGFCYCPSDVLEQALGERY